MGILETTKAVDSLSRTVVDYGFIVVIAAVFIIIVLYIMWTTLKKYNQMFSQILNTNGQFAIDVNKLVNKMTELLDIVKENQEGITERSKRYQTYTGAMKIIKNYFNATKLEILRSSQKIIEKNNITDVEALDKKLSIMIKGIQKKRGTDLREFVYCDICFADAIPININEIDLVKVYIQDKHRNIDKFINDLDTFYNDVVNDIEIKFVACAN
jgi:uncharacterized protein YoxC